ncbi:MAG TPA: hypothetical protein DCL38_00380 [Lachnospiraceae bacterium]|nr:hypothetical protein [Lachnospiraceae bacterium]
MADNKEENLKAEKAAKDASLRELFLAENSEHILRLAAKLSGHHITKSDDEWSIALIAASEALDRYDSGKGDFWGFASIVIKSRLLNYYKGNERIKDEISVSPSAFEGEVEEDDPELSLKLEMQDKMAVGMSPESSVREEILALEEELKRYNISFFDLTSCSPRSRSTRKGCAEVIASFFLPPPIVELLKRTGQLPSSKLRQRSGQSTKFLDKFRKYLIAAVLILDGDYPELAAYIPFGKNGRD